MNNFWKYSFYFIWSSQFLLTVDSNALNEHCHDNIFNEKKIDRSLFCFHMLPVAGALDNIDMRSATEKIKHYSFSLPPLYSTQIFFGWL
jgi:hypothetical protein